MSSASSPVLPYLNHDVMVYIFNLNTYMLENEYGCSFNTLKVSALHTARHTSQVCRSWRQVILQSSALWGSIMDVDALSKASNQWFEEVMTRTGQASLSIYGPAFHPPSINILISLLEENWDRVRQLDVSVEFKKADADYPASQFHRFHSILLERQAPVLQKFRVWVFGTRISDRDHQKGRKLFTGSAPVLQCFHSQDIHFSQNAPWIPQLLSVTLSGPLKTSEALNILVNTPLLESLFIPSTLAYDDDTESWKQSIQLPNLRILDLRSDIAGALVFLSHIQPKFNCALTLKIGEDLPNILKSDNDILQRLMKIIGGYVEGYFYVPRPQMWGIRIGNLSTQFTVYESWDEGSTGRWRHPDFQFSLGRENSRNASQNLDTAVVDMFLSTLGPAALNKVHECFFQVFHQSWLPTTDTIFQTVRSLTSVTKMYINLWALHGLNLIPDSANLFPHLKEVRIKYERNVKNSNEILRIFLTRRTEVGHPLQMLYKPDNCRPKGAKHWIFLKQLEGLRVISTGDGQDSDYSGDSDSDDDV